MSNDVGGHKGALSFFLNEDVGNDDGTWRTLRQCFFTSEILLKRKIKNQRNEK